MISEIYILRFLGYYLNELQKDGNIELNIIDKEVLKKLLQELGKYINRTPGKRETILPLKNFSSNIRELNFGDFMRIRELTASERKNLILREMDLGGIKNKETTGSSSNFKHHSASWGVENT
ncbi:hypothetical protein V7152_28295 [Neobacillus drentensis]|uniref:hypothetical protein n=1 Tax=Neobacillus drentensis TaxID=220684 RepID=UPI002FFF8834